ncbi:aminotransferase class I/II-fold pyridoxal phosphate-dependent enzyme [Filibacter tadaridae]|uniref:Arginine decarboxylase n=1 Tax=Filibacter tadaridae TaxID=2483811 RepID=A0A3P5WUF9_9BACL|nr:aminotransferase class I/II-fold pyridoxal phosphate-dependent enzyme [Filibacter tadaridae]VDC18921.1 Arginine decarboxylase [Filibacter tadaridae]
MRYTDRPLVQALNTFRAANPVSFHVPGHKNGMLSGLPDELRSSLYYDVTELEGLDDLHEPEGVIEEAQRRLASLYASDCSFFLVNGSTVGNLAMIYATCRAGDTVIVQRNAHKSIFHAIELTGAVPVFISPAWDAFTQTVGTVTAGQVKRALQVYPEAKAVVLTYPTYYGAAGTELQEVIRLCHLYKVPVLVDEAHGAHFVVGKPFPRSALEMGADVVVHSAHKTLPAMTMASYLHVRSDLLSYEKVAYYLRMLQSSSPSYLLMASLDDARAYAESYDEEDKVHFMEKRGIFIGKLEKIAELQTVEMDDPLKLLVRIHGYSGFDVQDALELEGIYTELADAYQVLFVLPLLKTGIAYSFAEIAKKIESAVAKLKESGKFSHTTEALTIDEEISCPVYTFKEIEGMETEWVTFEEALGRVAAASVIPYPPGIPLLIAGEAVLDRHIRAIKELVRLEAKIQGTIRLKEKQLLVVK